MNGSCTICGIKEDYPIHAAPFGVQWDITWHTHRFISKAEPVPVGIPVSTLWGVRLIFTSGKHRDIAVFFGRPFADEYVQIMGRQLGTKYEVVAITV